MSEAIVTVILVDGRRLTILFDNNAELYSKVEAEAGRVQIIARGAIVPREGDSALAFNNDNMFAKPQALGAARRPVYPPLDVRVGMTQGDIYRRVLEYMDPRSNVMVEFVTSRSDALTKDSEKVVPASEFPLAVTLKILPAAEGHAGGKLRRTPRRASRTTRTPKSRRHRRV
jgi:hypothetical protein